MFSKRSAKPLLKKKQVDILFSNLMSIYTLNGKFLNRLRSKILPTVQYCIPYKQNCELFRPHGLSHSLTTLTHTHTVYIYTTHMSSRCRQQVSLYNTNQMTSNQLVIYSSSSHRNLLYTHNTVKITALLQTSSSQLTRRHIPLWNLTIWVGCVCVCVSLSLSLCEVVYICCVYLPC